MGDNITLVVGGENFQVEKDKLRESSDYFRAMFSSQFQEEERESIELKSVELEPFRTLLQWVESDVTDVEVERLSTRDLMDILECSNMLQFSRVRTKCSQGLCSRISCENCVQLFQLADLVSDRQLLTATHRFILWNCHKLFNLSHLPHLDKNNFKQIISCPFLNSGSELSVLKAITEWIEVNKPDKSEIKEIFESCLYFNELEDTEEIKKNKYFLESSCDFGSLMSQTRRRRLPIVPCVVGHLYGKNSSKSVCMFSWSETERKVVVLCQIPSVQADQVVASGFKVASEGVNLSLSGGEFSLGYSNWNKNILSWDSLNKSWSLRSSVDTVRRHHSAILHQGKLWMFGGFGKHRLVLDNVDTLDLQTGEEKSVSNLPAAMYRPAVAVYKTSQIVLVGKQMVALFDTDRNTWTILRVTNYPTDLEFDRAMFDEETEDIYLTSSYSRTLFKCSLQEDNSCNMESVGKFTTETKNTCIVHGNIYNFNSEEFDDDRVLESYDIRSQQFHVLWKDNVPEWDFSPNYCLGCFPLVTYDFIS